jgi:hypothetical protein
MLDIYAEAASGLPQPLDDSTDYLYGLRELISIHALEDAEAYAGIFAKNLLDGEKLRAFDRYLELTIESYSGIDILPEDDIKTVLVGIEGLGKVYSDLMVECSGLEDNGHIDRVSAIVATLNTAKNYFIRLSTYSVTPTSLGEVSYKNE